jgi:hypothetical protein
MGTLKKLFLYYYRIFEWEGFEPPITPLPTLLIEDQSEQK